MQHISSLRKKVNPKTLIVVVLAIAVIAVLGLALLSLLSRRAQVVGLENGKLRLCPNSPNCVCSYASTASEHAIAPLTYTGNPDKAFAKLIEIVAGLARSKINRKSDRYLHAECQSALFRFVDDVEFLLDSEQNVIHVRSASRVGQSDLGTNRKRIELIRRKFEETRPSQEDQ